MKTTTQSWLLISAVGGALLFIAWYLGLFAAVFPPAGGTIALHDYFANDFRAGVEATTELCAGLDGCMEGYVAPDAEYRRFETTDQAEQFATRPGDVVADRHIAVLFDADIRPASRSSQLEMLRTTHRSG